METGNLKAALKYQKLGIFVLPFEDKHPRVKWKKRKDRPPDPAELREWWYKWPDAKVGMLCGKYSGIDVVDLDGPKAIERFTVEYGMPETVIVEEPVMAEPVVTVTEAEDYTVQSGDTLEKISKRFFGKASLWTEIYEANRDKLSAPSKIYPGQVILIPSIELMEGTVSEVK